MAIRIRRVDGVTIALCAVESDLMPDDLYLDDGIHYALAAKFMEDWKSETLTGGDPVLIALMHTQEVRDCRDVANQWQRAADLFRHDHPSIAEFGWAEIQPYWEQAAT